MMFFEKEKEKFQRNVIFYILKNKISLLNTNL
jgi:hypothetical protein